MNINIIAGLVGSILAAIIAAILIPKSYRARTSTCCIIGALILAEVIEHELQSTGEIKPTSSITSLALRLLCYALFIIPIDAWNTHASRKNTQPHNQSLE